MPRSFQDLLYKINYIEAEIEIQKQILFSLSDDERQKMEDIIGKISAAQQQIQEIRTLIQAEFPEEHEHIVKLENATSSLRKLAEEKNFTRIENSTPAQSCLLSLKDGQKIDCLIKAHEADGSVTVITVDGTLRTYSSSELLD